MVHLVLLVINLVVKVVKVLLDLWMAAVAVEIVKGVDGQVLVLVAALDLVFGM
tara:strand:- start:239 stop:397 length:159 start_codon:yes stop_codon:yes gene_type:complete